MNAPTLTTQLDKLEANLPTVPARIVRLQRAFYGFAFDHTAAAFTTVAGSTKTFLDTARVSGKTVTGQARAAGGDVLTTARTGVKTVAGQAGAAAKDVATTARTGAKTVSGQASAQGKKVSKTATQQTTKVIDSAIDAVDETPGSGKPYEQWTKAELVERARELHVTSPTTLNKKQLIAALRKA